LTAVIDLFKAAWQSNFPLDIDDVLSNYTSGCSPDQRATLLLELVAIDLEYRWSRSKENCSKHRDSPAAGFSSRPRIEDYLTRFPAIANRGLVPISLLVKEYRVRRGWGDQPGQDEYLARFPQYREALPHELSRVDSEWQHFFHEPQAVATLCLFRVLFGLVLVFNGCTLLPFARDFCGPFGMVGTKRFAKEYPQPRVSLFYLLPATDQAAVARLIWSDDRK